MPQLQPKPVLDSGSNRCIIRESYAVEQGLPHRTVKYSLEAVGGKEEEVVGNIYSFSLVDKFGIRNPVWAYGYESIMFYEAPDISSLMSKLPHVPKDAFSPMETGEIDLLMGLNFNHISQKEV